MSTRVVKFGGSSLANADQIKKAVAIVPAKNSRRYVVVSAPGKRFKDDHKITDLLYLCHAHLKYGVSCDGIFELIRSRYLEIRDELGVQMDLESEFAELKKKGIHYHLTNGKIIESTSIRTGFGEAVQEMLRDHRFFM